MIYWAQFFHFYQPATQLPSVLDKICDESYRPLLQVLHEFPEVRVTVNINAILTEMLQHCGHQDIIQGLKELGQKGQIEFVGSAKYHPILPLIPPDEGKRQIELNRKSNSFFFGDVYKPGGFFPPEMAYSRDIVPVVVGTGHRWIILGGVACPADWPVDTVYQVEHDGQQIAVFFRDDLLSNKISFQQVGPREFLEHLNNLKGDRGDIYVVTAMDAETYGHHIKDWEELFLSEVYEEIQVRSETYSHIKQKTVLAERQTNLIRDEETSRQVKTVTISQLIERFPASDVIEPKPSSWSTSADDINSGNPFPLWKHSDNEIHQMQWEHTGICMELCLKAAQVADSDESKHFAGIARGLLDRALQSDQFWWASRRPMWDINLIHMGLIDQWRVILNAYRTINKSGVDDDVKRRFFEKLTSAREIRGNILDQLFVL
jgi:alpha-amylase/alpha-mannosidase (GH57 family)